MAKKKVVLTEEQKRRNAEILARLEEEEQRIFEDTRELQREWKMMSNQRRRAKARERQQAK